jgi:hypothetical protein
MAKTTELGKFISTQRTYPSGDIVGYRVRSPKSGVEQYFGIKTFGTLEKALAEARKYAKEKLKVKVLIGDSEEYLNLRNTKKDLSAARFAKYLNDNTDFVPERGTKFTTDGIKQVDNKINFKSDVRKDKRIIPQNIKDDILSDYQQQLAKGERNLSVLGRKYYPDLTRDQQSNIIRKVLVEKGEDISQFRKIKGPNFDEVKDRGSRVRRERLGKGKKSAGFSAGKLSDSLISDIKKLNQDILNMSDEEILSNKKIINSMKINANINNLNKGIIAFDKYDDLSDKELVKKIKDRARQGIFWQPEHISSVQGEARNIYYPNNLQAAPGNLGSFMENFKRVAREDPTNPILNSVDELLSDYNLTVREPNTGVKLGFKDVIVVDSVNKTSNIITANSSSLGNKVVFTGVNDFFSDIRKDAVNNGPICGVVQKKNKGGPVISCVDAVEDAIQNNPQKLAQDASKLGKFKQAATGFLGFLKGPGPKTFGIGAGVGAAVGLVKAFSNDDPTTYLSNEDQQKNMLVDMATDPISIDIERPAILDYQLPALGATLAGSTALAAPSTIKASKSRALGIEKKKPRPGMAKTGLRVLGRGLGIAASPALLAPFMAGDIASQVAEGDSFTDIATDPLNYLYPAFADQTPKLTRGLNPTLQKVARLGLRGPALRLLSRAGIGGFAASAVIQGMDLFDD